MNNTFYTIEPNQELNTAWEPDSANNNKILAESVINSNWKYRQYMQKNAKQIMKYNTMEYIYTSGNNPFQNQNNELTNKSPYLYLSSNDNRDKNNNLYSDLKQDYLKNEKFKSRLIAPYIPTNF
uniref:Uncharacterized protein n=1 Tax=viral metagenome TaxID=1070528 RepID=A0A6C0KRZ7_9ZZZZ